MTEPKPELTKTERDALLAKYAYLIAEIRRVAELLGIPNPIPPRKERRQASEIDQSKP